AATKHPVGYLISKRLAKLRTAGESLAELIEWQLSDWMA
ncbi:hypothetical protein PSYJA_40665, partial [Pseudomonas syringae pv. japonica str. M301072]